MPQFIAVTSKGLADVLTAELASLDIKALQKGPAGVTFESNWEGVYRASLELRSATRILKPVLDFSAYQPEDLYNGILKHDFTKYISVKDTLAIDASVRDSSFRDQRFVALKVKDAIVDQFREKCGERPDVDAKTPDLRIMVRIVKNQVNVAVDTTGENLSQRGYRAEAGEAPLREHLAAGLLQMTGWNGSVPLVDPMCGSGTFLIEAALMLKKISPGSLRKKFSFQKFSEFKMDAWDKVVNESMSGEVEDVEGSEIKLFGFDVDSKVLKIAQRNAERAGVDHLIQFARMPIQTLPAPTEQKGILIVNPPYGERLGITEELKDVYRDLAHTLKVNFKGWDAWILSGNEELSKALKLKANRRFPVFNGPIECRFLEYKMNSK